MFEINDRKRCFNMAKRIERSVERSVLPTENWVCYPISYVVYKCGSSISFRKGDGHFRFARYVSCSLKLRKMQFRLCVRPQTAQVGRKAIQKARGKTFSANPKWRWSEIAIKIEICWTELEAYFDFSDYSDFQESSGYFWSPLTSFLALAEEEKATRGSFVKTFAPVTYCRT